MPEDDGDHTAATNGKRGEAHATPDRPNLVFRLVVPVAAVFVLTILAMIAATFGDPDTASARFFDRHGTRLLLWELAALVVVGLLAMAFDRWRILREGRFEENGNEAGP